MVDYRRYREAAPLLYGGALVLLLVVVTGLGSERKGSQAWFQLGPFQLQPSEFAKIVVIITLASRHRPLQQRARRLAGSPSCSLVAGVPMGLIMLQPDLGTTLVFVAITMGMLLVGGAQVRHIVALTLVGIVGVGVVLNSGMLETYQQCRLTSFLETQNQECAGARRRVQPGAGQDRHRLRRAHRRRALQGHPDPPRHRARAAHRLHLHGGGGGARLRRRPAPCWRCCRSSPGGSGAPPSWPATRSAP